MCAVGAPELIAGGVAAGLAAADRALVVAWGKGSFGTARASLMYHFGKHGTKMGFGTAKQYAAAARALSRNLGSARAIVQKDGSIKYVTKKEFIIMVGREIRSFGPR